MSEENELITWCFICGMIAVCCIWGISFFSGSHELKSKYKLEPIRYEITITGDKVDTLFIYRKP